VGMHAHIHAGNSRIDAPWVQNSIKVPTDARMTSKLLTAMITAQPTTPTYMTKGLLI
jgi:hypothetical protein